MDDSTPTPWRGAKRGMQKFAAVAIVLLVLWYFLATIEQPGHALGAGLVSIWLVLAALYGLLRLMRVGGRSSRARRAKAPAPVALAIGRPLLPVPNLQAAYEALPDHCWRVLNAPAEAS